MRVLYLCGAGNSEAVRLALTINARQGRWDRIVLLDDDAAKHGLSMLGVEIVGPFAMLGDRDDDMAEVANLIARTTARRAQAQQRIAEFDVPFARLVHPEVHTGGAELGHGVIVYQHATVGPEVSLGDGSVVFMHAAVGHESTVGRGCIVAPGAIVNARVRLGDGVYVGSNAVILPEITVGPGATIAAGSVAIEDVPPGATVLGVPGRILPLHRPLANGHPNGARSAGVTS